MALRVAKKRRADTVSYRNARGKTFNVVVWSETQPAVPTMNAPTTSTSGGTIATGVTCSYRVSVVVNGVESQAAAQQSVVTGAGSTNKCTITWNTVANATAYRVYGRTAGAQLFIAEVAAPTTTYDDLGTITPSGSLPVAGEIAVISPTKGGGLKLRSVPKATAVRQTDVYYLR